jgi:predicted enzyme related to lactoylglutathione lyase
MRENAPCHDAKRVTTRDATEVTGMGSFSIIADPTGAALGLWQPTAK